MLFRSQQPRIAELLAALAQVNGVRWIRLLYCHPRGISRELIETIRDEPVICKYLDMAIEHADDAVLAKMNRRITQAHLRERIAALRREIPGIALRTSVIVGFPTETEANVETLLQFLREIRFERLGAFTYSQEEGSASFQYPDQVPETIRQQRFDRLMQLQQEIAAELTAQAIGTTREVVIDERDATDPSQYLEIGRASCRERVCQYV